LRRRLSLCARKVTLRSADRILVALELGELVLKPIQPRGILRTMLDDHLGDQSDGADQPFLGEVSAGLHDLACVGLTRKM